MTSLDKGGAIQLIGSAGRDDYMIAPRAHAERYLETAPRLAELLARPDVQVSAEHFEELDGRALRAQDMFNKYSDRARSAVFWVGISAAAILAIGALAALLNPAVTNSLLLISTAGGVVASTIANSSIRSLKKRGMLERWMTRRAEAESERHHYFQLITQDAEFDPPVLQLEYFRRYQLDVQRTYYRERATAHRAESDRALEFSAGAIAVGGVATALAGVLGASMAPSWSGLAALGLVGQALASRSENWEATNQSRRNAERYERTRRTLDRLYGELHRVRAAVEAGDRDVLSAFVVSVHEQLSLEHRQWLEEQDSTDQAIGHLETLLQQYSASESQE